MNGINPDNGSPTDQFWRFSKDGFIQNTHSHKCLDVTGAWGLHSGANIELYDCEFNHKITDQKWRITDDGFIQNTLSGKCIDVSGVA